MGTNRQKEEGGVLLSVEPYPSSDVLAIISPRWSFIVVLRNGRGPFSTARILAQRASHPCPASGRNVWCTLQFLFLDLVWRKIRVLSRSSGGLIPFYLMGYVLSIWKNVGSVGKFILWACDPGLCVSTLVRGMICDLPNWPWGLLEWFGMWRNSLGSRWPRSVKWAWIPFGIVTGLLRNRASFISDSSFNFLTTALCSTDWWSVVVGFSFLDSCRC